MNTYDIYFDDNEISNNKGFKISKKACVDFIKNNNGGNDSYFGDYKGGTVRVVCNETGETVYQELVF